jgi:hypothetical protein
MYCSPPPPFFYINILSLSSHFWWKYVSACCLFCPASASFFFSQLSSSPFIYPILSSTASFCSSFISALASSSNYFILLSLPLMGCIHGSVHHRTPCFFCLSMTLKVDFPCIMPIVLPSKVLLSYLQGGSC